jgi:hypothetical protein
VATSTLFSEKKAAFVFPIGDFDQTGLVADPGFV